MTKQNREEKSRGDERREALVLAAYGVIAEKGFEGLRVRDVAAVVSVNIATLHYYFNTKEDLVKAVVDYLLHLFVTVEAPRPADMDEEQASAAQKMRWVFDDLEYQLQTQPEMFVVLTELHLRSQRDPAVSDLLKRLDEGWHAHIASIYREGVAQQAFNPDLDPDTVASLLIALIKGLSIQATSQLDHLESNRIYKTVENWLSRPA
jgi:AcrR family transcriptional regulator